MPNAPQPLVFFPPEIVRFIMSRCIHPWRKRFAENLGDAKVPDWHTFTCHSILLPLANRWRGIARRAARARIREEFWHRRMHKLVAKGQFDIAARAREVGGATLRAA